MGSDRKEKNSLLTDIGALAAALAFALYSFVNFTGTRERAPAPATLALSASRAPASVATKPAAERTTQVIHLGCLSGSGHLGEPRRSTASLLRLTAEACGPLKGLQGQNESTGDNLVILRKDNKLSTHYIPLKTGANRVRLEWKGPGGKAHRAWLEVERVSGG